MSPDEHGGRPAGLPPLAQLPLVLACVALFTWHALLGGGCLILLAVLSPPAVAWRPVAARDVLRRYLPFLLLWLLVVYGYLRLTGACGHPVAPQPMLQELAEKGFGMPGLAVVVVGIVVVAPLFEELVFRGYLFTALATVLPMWLTQLATAALFGLVHGLDYALPIGVLALLFGHLRQRHRALLPSILAHALHNGITVLMTLWWPEHLELLYSS